MKPGWAGALSAALAMSAGVVACSSDSAITRAALAQGCSIHSDCTAPLVCAFGKCHGACVESRDCVGYGPDVRCVIADKPNRVCQLPEEETCRYSSECPGTLVCAIDGKCREECLAPSDCALGQVCTRGVCADAEEVSSGALTPDAGTLVEGERCEYNTECAEPLICREGRCVQECFGDRDCAVGYRCDPTLRRCVIGE